MTTENTANYRKNQFDRLPESSDYKAKLFISIDGAHTNYMDITVDELEEIQELLTKVLYSFDELEDDIKQKVIEENGSINVDFEWWESTFEDAKNVLLKIDGFGLDRDKNATGNFTESAEETAEKIISEHGEKCETVQTAKNYIAERIALVKKYSDGVSFDIVAEDNEFDFDNDCDELDKEFLRAILEDYSSILQNEYDYLTGEEAITETIKCNEYKYTEDGEQD